MWRSISGFGLISQMSPSTSVLSDDLDGNIPSTPKVLQFYPSASDGWEGPS